MALYLVRHGKTSWNEIGRAQGHTDIPLNEVGLQQLVGLEAAFRGKPIDLILSSDLNRSFTTSQAIQRATGAPIETLQSLRERSFGDWEGSSFAEVNSRLDDMATENGTSFLRVAPPNGESYADVWTRLDPILARIETAGDANLVVSAHGGTLSTLMARLVRGTLESARSFRFHNTSITELERRADGYFAVLRFNDTAHLVQHEAVR